MLFVFCPLQLLKSQSPGSPGVNHSQTRVVREPKAALNHRMEGGAGAAFCDCAAEGWGGFQLDNGACGVGPASRL